ncbi:oxygenase MpaB family protein [Spirillospora albida]|uniref:oxygenase MpaB family protein n=1 Tax=Spirillospora albida TaxID=58123 RepID=UPI000563AAEB|nr:oxygenase MpaB family protein [Spirillospora albida]
MTETDVRRTAAGSIPGPGSLIWRYAGDWRGVFGGRAILLLQVAHPVVGAGVGDHSQFVEDRWGRLTRTVESTIDFLGYRGEERGRLEAARLREIHKDIKGVDAQGRRYHALNPEAYLWVHATLLHGMIQTQELFGTPITPRRARVLHEEWTRLGLALGITERHIPESPATFREYVDSMIHDRLENNDTVQLLIELDRRPLPPPPGWPLPASAWGHLATPPSALLRRTGIASLPPVLRDRFGLRWTSADERRFQIFARSMRAGDKVMIDRLRYSPIASRAMRRARRAQT